MVFRSLIFHHSPTAVMVGYCEDGSVIESHSIPHREASKELIPRVDALLKQPAVSIAELSYIGCNIGPAPFTTLRTVVVTVNGLGFAAHIPLIGINGIICLAAEICMLRGVRTYAVMNAFGAERYYAVYDPIEGYVASGVIPSAALSDLILPYRGAHTDASFCIVGNKAEEMDSVAQGTSHLQVMSEITYASLQSVALEAYRLWNAREVSTSLVPYYGK